MSGAAAGSNPAAKPQEDKKPEGDPAKTSQQQPLQPSILEEDDEFEDFPVEGESPQSLCAHDLLPLSTEMLTHGFQVDWTQEEAEVPGGNAHLWEESWDDDDENEDFSKQLK